MAITAGELIRRARYELHDKNGMEYTDDELLHYLSDAVELLSRLLIEARSTHSIREAYVTISPIALPDGFVALAEYDPKHLKIVGNDIHCKHLPCKFKYYAEYSRPDTQPEKINYFMDTPEVFAPILAQMVTARALNRNEYNTSLEQQYIQVYTTEIIKLSRQRDGLVSNAERKPKYEV